MLLIHNQWYWRRNKRRSDWRAIQSDTVIELQDACWIPIGTEAGESFDLGVQIGSHVGKVDVREIERREHLLAKTAFRLLQYDVSLAMKQWVYPDALTYRTIKHMGESPRCRKCI